MAVPKKRHTKSRRDKRRMHIYLKEPALMTCPKCGKKTRFHTVCPYCGYYKEREIIKVLEKLTKKERKEKEKEIRVKEKGEVKKKKPLTLKELSKK